MSSRQISKREQARLAEQQAAARNARNARLAVVGTLALVVLAVIGLVLAQQGGGQTAAAGPLTGAPPWPAQPAGLTERVEALGFPPVGDESYHAHVLLTVYRNGQQVPVPADMGYDERGSHASLHTHTPDGVIHMEADDPYPYRLSHVFRVWGVDFALNRLGGDVARGPDQVHIYVNGQHTDSDVVLEDGDNVVVAYGRAGSFPTEPDTGALATA
ncbi:MAG: hypothetical protein JWM62_2255 [Frankiales bacterium]|jgi:hypothetical protein|nr:hypothetical protein [Frankiales bacterium]